MWKEKTYLSTIKHQLTENLMLVKDNFMSLSEAELNKNLRQKKWNIAQYLDHLIQFDRHYLEQIQRALKEQDLNSQGEMFHPSLMGRLFIKMMRPGGKIKLNTGKAFKPGKEQYKKSILEAFEKHQSELMELVIMADGKDLKRIKVKSPINSLFKFRLGDILYILALHQRGQINQALEIKEDALDKD